MLTQEEMESLNVLQHLESLFHTENSPPLTTHTQNETLGPRNSIRFLGGVGKIRE